MNKILEVALSQIGIKEIIGTKHSPQVLKYFHQTGFKGIRNDETAWCSAFVNWVAYIAGYQRSGALNARSWLDIGERINFPKQGDIVIFWRESVESWKGHVGIFINQIDDDIFVLGGNQDNQVCIKKYPVSRLLAFRRLQFVGWK